MKWGWKITAEVGNGIWGKGRGIKELGEGNGSHGVTEYEGHDKGPSALRDTRKFLIVCYEVGTLLCRHQRGFKAKNKMINLFSGKVTGWRMERKTGGGTVEASGDNRLLWVT